MDNLGITAVWSAKVANRKIARLMGTPLDKTDFVIAAEASSDDANAGALVGSLPTFQEGNAIPLGQITSTGLFIPPKGGVYRKTRGEPVEPFPAVSRTVADTTCDGSVTARLVKDGKDLKELNILSACIVVAPPDFSPDIDPDTKPGDPRETLSDFLRRKLQLSSTANPGNLHNQTATAIDEAALKPCTEDFAPGFEVSFGARSEVLDVKSVFYQAAQDSNIDPREMRVRYRAAPGSPGAVPGQLTSGLCSTWHGDFTACVGYWTENLPPDAFLDENSSIGVQVFRRRYSDIAGQGPVLQTGDDFERHVDEVGVVRMMNGKQLETERDPGDDIVDGIA
jgi:hypothetical protein